jgi:hypothetical protein
MKKIILSIIVLFFILGIESCSNSLLEVKNYTALNPSDIWNDKVLADSYLTNLYSFLSGWPINDGGKADESDGIITEGFVQTTNTNFKYWPYEAIRKINILLSEIDGGSLDEDVKNQIKGQAQFLRAYHYFKAVVYHGGVPIIKKPQLLNEDLMVIRNSTKECFDFIIADLDYAISVLSNKFSGNNYGRIDKATALAFKVRVLIFKASPQFNPLNPFGNAYWQEAYTAAKAAKDQLESFGYGLINNYDDIFLTEMHKEVIFPIVYTNPGKLNSREAGIRPLSQSKNATGYDQPIWSLVNSYPMKDGKLPGKSSNYVFNLQTYWQDRDPRFYSTIAYNACVLPLGVSSDHRQYNDGEVGNIDDGFFQGETFERTGFYCRKGMDNSLKQAEVGLNALDWIEIRFAEVLMNFAEAANETGHPSDAIDVLKKIRQRAGIDAGVDGMYGITAATKEQIRDAIHFENYIEFAFEAKRFWELRRMRLLHTTINGMRKYGLLSTLKAGLDPNAKVTYLPKDFDNLVQELFVKSEVKTMYTPESYYFFPISKDEMDKNPKLTQNVGWDNGTFDPTLK